jgi:hypothetical protein
LRLRSLCNNLSDESMGLSFATAAGLRQCSHSQVRVPWDSWAHFTVSNSRLPQPGGPGPLVYISQEEGGPVIPPGTGFPFRRLLRLAGLRWRYSTPPPHRISSQIKVWAWVLYYDRRPAGLGIKHPSGTYDQIFITVKQLQAWCGALSLTRGRVCRLQPPLALASAVIFGSESHIFLLQIWDFPFRRLLRLAGLRWRYSTRPPHGSNKKSEATPLKWLWYDTWKRTHERHQLLSNGRER